MLPFSSSFLSFPLKSQEMTAQINSLRRYRLPGKQMDETLEPH